MSSDLVDLGQGAGAPPAQEESSDQLLEDHIAAITRDYHIEPRLGTYHHRLSCEIVGFRSKHSARYVG